MRVPLFHATILFALVCLANAGEQTGLSRVVVGVPPFGQNDGRILRELFEHPYGWQETRTLIDEILYADQCFKPFSDDELKAWFALMKRWHLRLGLDVGAIKEWGQTSEKSISVGKRYWERIQSLGGHIYAMHMDEPFHCARFVLHKSDDYAVEETAKYIAGVRKDYPDVLIGDIETYPSFSLKEHMYWIDALQKKLAGLKVRGLDFYELDVNWMNFQIQHTGSWQEVKQLQTFCHSRKLPFSLIFWPGSYGWFRRLNLADDNTWYVSVMNEGYEYAALDGWSGAGSLQGGPDQYVIQSWEPCPSHGVPETGDFTLTRLVLDFVKKFVRR